MSLTPRHLSPKLRRASASSTHSVTLTESSPRLVRTTSPARPDPVAQVELDELVEALGHRRQREQLHRARAVAQLGERQLALGPEEHDAAGDRDGDAGLLPGGERGPGVDDGGRLVACARSDREGRAAPRSSAADRHVTLRSYTMRRPCRVSQGSTWSMVSEYGAMSELKPPVATTVDGPSSSMKRLARPSTSPAKP